MNKRKVTVKEERTAMGQRQEQTQVVSHVDYGFLDAKDDDRYGILARKEISFQGVAQGREVES
jgi:hypothetical protein